MRHWELRKCSSMFSGSRISEVSLAFVGDAETSRERSFGISTNHLRTSTPIRLKMRSSGGIRTLEI